jgi:hypothetical protein
MGIPSEKERKHSDTRFSFAIKSESSVNLIWNSGRCIGFYEEMIARTPPIAAKRKFRRMTPAKVIDPVRKFREG